MARLIGCLVLVALTIGSAITKRRNSKDTAIRIVTGVTEVRLSLPSSLVFSFNLLNDFVKLYAVLLAFITLFAEVQISGKAIFHLNAILLSSFGVYAYRDLWPLATFTKIPEDISEGWYLWARIVVLAFVGVVIPSALPTEYVPVNPKVHNTAKFTLQFDLVADVNRKNPMPEPNLEQTASLFSRLTYTYLDSLILLASRHLSLTVDQLPALADSDCAQHLVETSFPRLDPYSGAKQRHLFWALIDVFSE